MTLYARRRAVNLVVLTLSMGATAIGLIVLAMILGALLYNGVPALNWSVFTQTTPPPGSAGGLANAIYGSFIITLVGTVIGTPLGVLTGTFLAEYGRGTWLAPTVRFVNDILLSAPSIVIGLFVYQVVVYPTHGFSAWAGGVALAIIVVPIVVRTTENMLALVPSALREAAAALGAPRWKVVVTVTYRAAIQGMVTGVMLAVARIAGESAPLLFTALNNQFWNFDMSKEMANLPVVIFQFALSPYEDWQNLAWAGALIITVTILLLNILARYLAGRSSLAR